MIKIFLANDHYLFRNGVRTAFKKYAPHIQIIGEAASFAEVLNMLPQFPADILVIDDAMPDRSLLKIIPKIKAQYPSLKIIINSMLNADHNDESKEIMKLADGWVCFNSTEQDFVDTIENVITTSKRRTENI